MYTAGNGGGLGGAYSQIKRLRPGGTGQGRWESAALSGSEKEPTAGELGSDGIGRQICISVSNCNSKRAHTIVVKVVGCIASTRYMNGRIFHVKGSLQCYTSSSSGDKLTTTNEIMHLLYNSS